MKSLGLTFLGTSALMAACVAATMPEAPEGAVLFAENCAGCHGAAARGDGAAAAGLSKTPPDLTQIQKRAGGTFPVARTLSTIDGYARGTHTARVMPEFGALLTGDTVPVEVDGVLTPTPRPLAALLVYLQSVQEG